MLKVINSSNKTYERENIFPYYMNESGPFHGTDRVAVPQCEYSDRIYYRFNSLGYRSCEFYERGDVNVMGVGCSFMQAIGIPEEDSLLSQFCKYMTARTGKHHNNWNLGMGSGSNDYISRTVLNSLPLLKPDILLVNFTYLQRREVTWHDGRAVRFNPTTCQRMLVGNYGAAAQGFMNLLSPNEDLVNFSKNTYIVEAVARQYNCKILYSIMPQTVKQHALIKPNPETYFVGEFRFLDIARDNLHPGIQSHSELAKQYVSKYDEFYS